MKNTEADFETTTAPYPLPALEHDDLNTLRSEGWRALGVVAAMLNEDQEILMLKHRESQAFGPLAETSKWHDTNQRTPETSLETLERSLAEELSVRDPITAHYDPSNMWFRFVGHANQQHQRQHTFAISSIMSIDKEVLDNFVPTPEIIDALFLPINEARYLPNHRPGVREWLEQISMRLIQFNPTEQINLQPTLKRSHLEDIDLRSIAG